MEELVSTFLSSCSSVTAAKLAAYPEINGSGVFLDYKGQLLAENLYFYIIMLLGAVGWVVGFVMGDFKITLMWWTAGMVLSIILVVPDWPMFNRHPTKWLEALPPREGVMPVGAAEEAQE